MPHPVKIENLSGSRTKRQAEGSLRIKVFYHKSVDDLVPSEKRLVKKVVSFAFFSFPFPNKCVFANKTT